MNYRQKMTKESVSELKKYYEKKLWYFGFITIVNSTLPILIWSLIGFIIKDNSLISLFQSTYSLQWLPWITMIVFISGNIIGYNKKEIEEYKAYSGHLVNSLFWILILCICTIYLKDIAKFMEISYKYKYYLLYNLYYTGLQSIILGIVEFLYFEENNEKAFQIILTFNLIYTLTLIITSIFFDSFTGIMISLSILISYVMYEFIKSLYHPWKEKKIKFSIDLFKGVKYRYTTISSYIMMFLLYFIGIKNVAVLDPEFLIIMSISSMSTDVQWDMLTNACDGVGRTEISKGQCDMKILQQATSKFTNVLIISCLLTFTIFNSLYKKSWIVGFLLLTVNLFGMLLHRKTDIKECWLDIEINGKELPICKIGTRIIRFIISLIIPNQYALYIAQISSDVLNYICVNVLYQKFNKENG